VKSLELRVEGLGSKAKGSTALNPEPSTLNPQPSPPRLDIRHFFSRLTEISSSVSGSPLTLTFKLVLEAQRAGEPVAWIGRKDAPFYPPDVADAGVDLAALPVVWTASPVMAAKAADLLVRSGAFGLVVLDLGSEARLPMHATSRLAMLARQHDAAIVCLTGKEATRPSLGPLVSLRAHTAARTRSEGGRFRCEAVALKDKRQPVAWKLTEVCRGPDGLH
jgi:recombination protein RecA